jgi:hypothetical protein
MAERTGSALAPGPPPGPRKPIDNATRARATAVARSVDRFQQKAQRATEVSRRELEEVAEKYARAPSGFLAAIIGGAVGSAGGIALGSVAGGTLVVLTGPIGLAAGAALAVLAFRGRSWFRLERATHKATGAATFFRSELDSLPSDAPEELRKKLYDNLAAVYDEYARVARDSVDDRQERPRLALGAPEPASD